MTPPLRRAHRIIWLLLAIALPVGFVAALRAVRPPLSQEPIARQPPAPLPVLVRSVATDSIIVNLRRAIQGTEQQIEIIVNEPVEVSATVEVQQQDNWRAVGLLNAPGTYRFGLPATKSRPTVRFVDNLHRLTLRTVQF